MQEQKSDTQGTFKLEQAEGKGGKPPSKQWQTHNKTRFKVNLLEKVVALFNGLSSLQSFLCEYCTLKLHFKMLVS